VPHESRAWIGLGSNLGARASFLAGALAALERAGHRVVSRSSVFETEPVGGPPQPWFLNMAIEVETAASPLELLDDLLAIELHAGRVREEPDAPRTLDLDLLAFDERCLDHPRLVLPHPRMWCRRFVLAPLLEIAPQLENPENGRTVAEELALLAERPAVRRVGRLAPGGEVVV
jgi:2-amino-4-hydroxy-6-hydroxymethyldihydropteridine diphosphokinase